MMVTIPEAARRLKVSVPTVRRQVKAGELPVVHVGKSVRINLAQVCPADEVKVAELAMAARSDRSSRARLRSR